MSDTVEAGPVELTCSVAGQHADSTDAEARFPDEALTAMRQTGLLGLMAPAEFGGGDGTLTDLVTTTIELGKADMSVAMIFAMHCQQVATLARYGGGRLRSEVLPAVAEGKMYLASVTTEAGKGGHLLTSESPVDQAGDVLRIDRRAPIVTGGAHADGFLITMAMPGATSPAQVDLLYAARDQVTLEILGDWQPLGARATESLPMRLVGAVPEWQVIGEHGGFRAVAAGFFAPVGHIGWAAAWLGAAAGAYSRVLGYIRSANGRKQFDPSSELLLTRLADARARLDVVHALLRHTVSVVESAAELTTPSVQLLVNALKTEAATGCFAVADMLVELTGLRHGYLTGSPLRLERTFRDLRSASLNYGNDRLRLANGSLALMDTGVRLA
ncbi:acyl-CoA dehydrogenase family protein [Kibdelosporangium persicum]|uniref:Acyl-CoA dehydrogenase, C-terminal domain n=1 Tax=Kibdelosporangium persicum TaxID=2698649 RepID=A0ABX2FDH0_9PSEU|nr:acyl-CoA dehydrogenase family protein [Kibdelosporangium persicum]NRN69415.1 Acyl-CoA dehydrogenase, C-terminal domain [Kibdelosporangium persicum]